MNNLITNLIAVTITLTTVGCGVLRSREDNSPPVNISIVSPPLIYVSNDPSGKTVTVAEVSKAIAERFPASSRYGEFKTYKTDYRNWDSTKGNYGVMGYHQKGVKAGATAWGIKTGYYHGYKSISTGDAEYTASSANFEIVETTDQKNKVFTIKPLTPVVQTFGYHLFVRHEAIGTKEEVAADMRSAIAKIRPSLKREFVVSSFASSENSTEVVTANFTRLLTVQVDSKEARKYLFEHPELKMPIPIEVTVFPYGRNQSKIRYSFKVPYWLNPDGTTSFDKGISNEIETRIHEIIKD